MSRNARTLQRGLFRARARGWKIIEPRPNEIQIDLDGARALHVFSAQWRMLAHRELVTGWRYRLVNSRTPGHVHITVTLPHARPLRERVLLACLLGSDRKREAFNYIRILTRRRVPVAFFRRK